MTVGTLTDKTCWIFDMDGTLTLAAHDFEAIRAQLGVPPGQPILEYIARQPAAKRKQLDTRLHGIELEIAGASRAQPGAGRFLDLLRSRGALAGIVTRNALDIARATLNACGLDHHFADADIVSRGCAAPKPAPDGVLELLQRWRVNADSAVMVGDYWFDLQAGRGAGLTTVHLDVAGRFEWPELADHRIRNFDQLLALTAG